MSNSGLGNFNSNNIQNAIVNEANAAEFVNTIAENVGTAAQVLKQNVPALRNAKNNSNTRKNRDKMSSAAAKITQISSQLSKVSSNLVSVATNLASYGPGMTIANLPKTKKNNAVKKPRTAAQLSRNQNVRNAFALFKTRGYKGNLKSISAYIKHKKEGKPNNDYFSTLGAPTALATIAEGEGEGVNATPKERLTHSEAGKKAAASEKGAQWLKNVKNAKNLLNSKFAAAGIKKTAKRPNAAKLASLLRKNPSEANSLIASLMQ